MSPPWGDFRPVRPIVVVAPVAGSMRYSGTGTTPHGMPSRWPSESNAIARISLASGARWVALPVARSIVHRPLLTAHNTLLRSKARSLIHPAPLAPIVVFAHVVLSIA